MLNRGEEKSAELKQEANTDHHKEVHSDTHDYEEVHSDTHDYEEVHSDTHIYEEVLNSAKNSTDHRQNNVGQYEDTNVVIVSAA